MWIHLVALELISGASATSAVVVPTGGGANKSTGLYPGYAKDHAREQTGANGSKRELPEALKVSQKIPPVKTVSAPVYPVAKDGKALRRVVNDALRDKQIQMLGQLKLSLQASQAQQQAEISRLMRINNDNALIALLLTL